MATSANTINNTQSIDVLGLQPNQNYIIKVYAVHTAADGTVTHSDYSVPLNITTPAYAPGGNFAASNDGTDIQLNGGSLFAGDFGTSPGSINVVTDTVDGTGVILNQTGLAGYNSGVQEFYLDASTGNAYFAGTIGATIIESSSYSSTDPVDGSAFASSGSGMAINLANGTITAEQFRIDTSGNAVFAGAVSGNATINGTLASDLTYAATQAYIKVQNAVTSIAGVLSNASGQLQTVSANGTTFYSGNDSTKGARILINQYGILGYNSSSTGLTDGVSFAILSQSQTINGTSYPAGSAYFTGIIEAPMMYGCTIEGSIFYSANYGSGNSISISGSNGSDYIQFNPSSAAGSSSGGSAYISMSSESNALRIIAPGGAEAMDFYGSGTGGVPNTILIKQVARLWADDTFSGSVTIYSGNNLKNTTIANFAPSLTSGAAGVGGSSGHYNGDIWIQYS